MGRWWRFLAVAVSLVVVDQVIHGSFFSIMNILFDKVGLLLILLFFPQLTHAQKAVPELWGQRVHDDAHVLSTKTVDELEKGLAAYQDSTSNQIAILIIQSLDGDVLEDYSIRVAEKWKLGQADKDNGVLLLVAVDDHKMRIEVGQGLEGVLTDAIASRIIRNEMAPNFRRGDYDTGIKEGVDGIIKAIGGEYSSGDDGESSDIDDLTIGQRIGIGLGLFVFLGIFAFFGLAAPGKMGWVLLCFSYSILYTLSHHSGGDKILVLARLYLHYSLPHFKNLVRQVNLGSKSF